VPEGRRLCHWTLVKFSAICLQIVPRMHCHAVAYVDSLPLPAVVGLTAGAATSSMLAWLGRAIPWVLLLLVMWPRRPWRQAKATTWQTWCYTQVGLCREIERVYVEFNLPCFHKRAAERLLQDY